MKFEITQWLQEAIYKHAQEMACAEAHKKQNDDDKQDFYASDYTGGYGYGNSPSNPDWGTFKFDVSRRIRGEEQKHIIELEVRDVIRDYVNGDG